MKRGLLIFLAIIGGVFSMFSKELRKAEVISDGDRGLALEWVRDVKKSIYDMTNDEYGNIYVLLTEGTVDFAVLKYSLDGKLQWKKVINVENGNGYFSGVFYRDQKLYFIFHLRDHDLYYDNIMVNKKNGTFVRDILMEISTKDGNFSNCLEMNNFFPEGLSFYITERKEKIINSVITDGVYQADGYTMVYPKFTGMDEDKYKSEVRSKGATDYYFAKFDKDDNLVWDFALGGEGADERYPLDRSFNGDTMFVCMSFESDSIDIDPDPAHEVWVYGKRIIWNHDNMGLLMIQYNISGDRPVLMSYKEIEYTWFAVYHYIYSHPKKGTYMAVENPDYRIERNGDIYRKSGDSRMYARVDDKCNIIPLDSIPTSNGLNEGWLYYQYDEDENLYVPNSRINFSRGDSLPIVLNFTKDHKEYISNEIDTWHTSVSKFDRKGNYLWSIMMKNIDSDNMYCSGKNGYIILNSGVTYKRDYITDCNPDPNKETILNCPYSFLHKYRETYRISADPTDHGEVIVPDTFAWHGEDYEIGVHPDEGYKLKKLTANGEEILSDENGKYYVTNVTEPICVEAQFSEVSSIQEHKSYIFEIKPNIVEHYIELSDIDGFASYKIVDMRGKVIREERISSIIDVERLTPGRYQIVLRGEEGERIGTFIKR